MKLLQGDGQESGVCGAGKAFQSSSEWAQSEGLGVHLDIIPHDRTKPWWAALDSEKAKRALAIHMNPNVIDKKSRKVEKALKKDLPNFNKYRAKCEAFVNEKEEELIGSVMEWAREDRGDSVFVTPDYEAKRAKLCQKIACKKKKKKKGGKGGEL